MELSLRNVTVTSRALSAVEVTDSELAGKREEMCKEVRAHQDCNYLDSVLPDSA